MKYSAVVASLLGMALAQGEGPDTAPFPIPVYSGRSDPAAALGASTGQTSPPKYPSPWARGSSSGVDGGWADSYKRAQAFVASLTLAEKVNLTTGTGYQTEKCVGQTGSIPRLGFRGICLQDSAQGVRGADFSSVFPSGVTIAASFDHFDFYNRGLAIGQEFRTKGVDVILGPVVGPLGRNPTGGRYWEGFSPDPWLTSLGVQWTIKGIQDAGVICATKHFIGYEQEHFRKVSEANSYGYNITAAYSSNIDDRTLHELYMWPFADAVRQGTGAVMCSHNQVNNTYGCENSYMLNYLLKNELDFQGFVVSDWGAQQSGVGSALAGLDMSMPGDIDFHSGTSYWGANLTAAVMNGTLPEWRLDDMATRIMSSYYKMLRDKRTRPINFSTWVAKQNGVRNFADQTRFERLNFHTDARATHDATIRSLAARSMVLLKNVNKTLPLTGSQKFTAVFGKDAAAEPRGPNPGYPDHGNNNSTLAEGWGSGASDFPFISTPLDAITQWTLTNGKGIVRGVTDNYASAEIPLLASKASVAIVFVNSDSGEGYISLDGNQGDRNNLTVWDNGEQVVRWATSQCNNTIVVVHSVGPVEMQEWKDNPNVTGLIWAGLSGQEQGNSIVDILYGKINPGGKLPFTVGKKRADWGTDVLYQPNNGAGAPQINFEEGVFIDYRAYDKYNVTPTYEFGFGLSYTQFNFEDICIEDRRAFAAPFVPNNGTSKPAPQLSSAAATSNQTSFPPGFQRDATYIYPWLNGTDIASATGDANYGNYTLPPGANDTRPQPQHPNGGTPGGHSGLYDVLFTVYARIHNVGPIVGEEVPQLYISLGGPDDPVRQLRGIERTAVPVNAHATFGVDVLRRDLSNWDPVSQTWFISDYPKTAWIGSSSRNLPLTMKFPDLTNNGMNIPTAYEPQCHTSDWIIDMPNLTPVANYPESTPS